MKAAVYQKYGAPEVVSISDIPKPKPTSKQVLIKVHASTVNRTDCGFRSAEYFIVRFFSGLFVPRCKVLGCEYSGVVEEIGDAVTEFKVGDKVFGYNDTKFGGHAEYICVEEESSIATMPAEATFEEAAALTEGAHYAWNDILALKITKDYNVLVNGATGAIGSAAVQIIKHHIGAKVTAVCDTKNIELVKSLGADVVIDYKKDDFTKRNDSFDVIFDAVGKSTFGKCKKILKPKGIYVSTELGPGSQNVFLAMLSPLMGGKKVIFPLPVMSKEMTDFLKSLFESKKFKPVLDQTFTLDNIVEAHRYVETGMKTGNVIIKIIA